MAIIMRALRMNTREKGYRLFVSTKPALQFEGKLQDVLVHACDELVSMEFDPDTEIAFIYEARTWWEGRLDWLQNPDGARVVADLVEHCMAGGAP